MINIQGLKAKISEKGVVKGTANNKIVYEKLENIEELIDDINNEVVEGSAVDKLNYLDDTKDQIKEAIKNKGVEVEDTDTFRNYAERIDEIPQDKFLDVGGKNPVLVKEYHEVIPFSETNFPNIDPSSSSNNIRPTINVDEINIDLDNYDYVLVGKGMVEYVYKSEVPNNVSSIKRMININVQNFIRISEGNMNFTGNTYQSLSNNAKGTLHHEANRPSDSIGFFPAGAFFINASEGQLINQNRQMRLRTGSVNCSVNYNRMSAEAYDLVDAEKTILIFDIKVYQVDKGTSPVGVWGQEMVDYVLGGN